MSSVRGPEYGPSFAVGRGTERGRAYSGVFEHSVRSFCTRRGSTRGRVATIADVRSNPLNSRHLGTELELVELAPPCGVTETRTVGA